MDSLETGLTLAVEINAIDGLAHTAVKTRHRRTNVRFNKHILLEDNEA